MNRVEIVNLAGRARHIESGGTAAIDAWLETARVRLDGDPDRDDLLLDFQHAIGEKCDALASEGHEVITSEQVARILESLGTIEPSSEGDAPAATGAAHVEERVRRLYRLPDERLIAGVCSGIAAWLRTDVTVIRVAWVLVPILAIGLTDAASLPLSVALYALLAFVLPRANSPEARAAAHGLGATAQDRLMQARSGAMPALTTLGSQLGAIIGVTLQITRVLLLIAITALLVIWVVGAGWLAVAGDPALAAFGDVPRWLVPVFLTCVAVMLIAPLAATVAVLDHGIRASSSGRWQQGHLTAWLLSATAAWVAAGSVAVVVVLTVPGVRDVLTEGEGRVTFRSTTYCFTQGSDDAHCAPGDEIVMLTEPPRSQRPPYLAPMQPLHPSIPALPALPPDPEQPLLRP